MSKEIIITFKCDEKMAEWVSKEAFDMDKTKSELIRCCLLLSVDTVKANPSLVNRIQFEDRKQ